MLAGVIGWGSSSVLNVLKWTQIGVAFTTFLVLLLLFVPSIEMFLVFPIGAAYFTWAIRAKRDKKWSMWLALTSSVLVAVVLSGLLVGHSDFTKSPIHSFNEADSLVKVDGSGNVSLRNEVPAEVLMEVREQRLSSWRTHYSQILVLVAFALIAWALVLMHAFQWRWLLGTRND